MKTEIFKNILILMAFALLLASCGDNDTTDGDVDGDTSDGDVELDGDVDDADGDDVEQDTDGDDVEQDTDGDDVDGDLDEEAPEAEAEVEEEVEAEDDSPILSCDDPRACTAPYKCWEDESVPTCECQLPADAVKVENDPDTMAIDGNTVYIISGSTLSLYDITDPTAPSMSKQVELSGNISSTSAIAYDGYLYLSNYNGSIHAINLSTLDADTVEVHSISAGKSPTSLSHVGSRFYAADRQGYVVLDHNGTKADGGWTLVKAVNLGEDTQDIKVAGNYAYVARGSEDLAIYDISDLDNIVTFKELDLSNYGPWTIEFDEPYVYLGTSNQFFVVYVGDLDAPVADEIEERAMYNLPSGTIYDIVAYNDGLYVGMSSFGVAVFDKTNPEALIENGYYKFEIEEDDKSGGQSSRGGLVVNDNALVFDAIYDPNMFVQTLSNCIACAEGSKLSYENVCSPERAPEADEIIITEFLPVEYPGVSEGEWFEVYNTKDDVFLVLDGCILENSAGQSHTITSLKMLPNATAGFFKDIDEFAGYIYDYGNSGDFSISNDSNESIKIKCAGVEVASLSWTTNVAIQEKSYALSLDHYNVNDYTDMANWCRDESNYYNEIELNKADYVEIFGTPGWENEICGTTNKVK